MSGTLVRDFLSETGMKRGLDDVEQFVNRRTSVERFTFSSQHCDMSDNPREVTGWSCRFNQVASVLLILLLHPLSHLIAGPWFPPVRGPRNVADVVLTHDVFSGSIFLK